MRQSEERAQAAEYSLLVNKVKVRGISNFKFEEEFEFEKVQGCQCSHFRTQSWLPLDLMTTSIAFDEREEQL